MAILIFMSGFFTINFSFLNDENRRLIAFSFFIISSLLSLKNILTRSMAGSLNKSAFFGFIFIVYVIGYSFINSPIDTYGSNKYYYSLLIFSLAFIFIPYIIEVKNISFFVNVLIIVSLLYCLIAIAFSSSESRTGGSNLNPALLARICMIAGIYALINIKYDTANIYYWIVFFISIFAVFFTGTKTPLPVAIASFIIVTNKNISMLNLAKTLTIFLLILGLSYFSIKYLLPEHLGGRILDLESFSSENQGREGNRLDLYETSLKAIYNNIWGYGLGGFSIHHRFITAPHNIILEYLIELGIIISTFFLFLIAKTLILIKKSKNRDINYIFIESLFIYMLISLLFGGEITIQSLFLYLTMALIINWQKRTVKSL